MQDTTIQVNPRGSLEIRHVGNEKTPVIVIDDFLLDTAGVIEGACRAVDYGPDYDRETGKGADAEGEEKNP